MIPIILTGTILPNSIIVVHHDWEKRRQDYIYAIRYYRQFSNKLYFIENSDYDLAHDSAFCTTEGFRAIQYKKSRYYERGKGYQEFEMLDNFVKNDLQEDCFVKITGRYIYKNFSSILAAVSKDKKKYELIIDSFVRLKTAITAIFYVNKSVYLNRLNGLYLNIDDSVNVYAEHVIYNNLSNVNHTFFATVPILNAISGSTGQIMMTNENFLKISLKNTQRKCFRALNIRQLLK